jgi:predicted dehydrogenase
VEGSLKAVLVGCGYTSGFQLAAWRDLEDVDVLAVSSHDLADAQARAAEFAVPAAYDNYERMLDEVSPDFVDIATPAESHLELTRAAAERGIHVLCQKPMAETRNEIEAMIDVCERNGVVLTINENARFQPWFRTMQALVSAGRLGVPRLLRFVSRAALARRPGGFGEQAFLAGKRRLIVLDLGVHFVDTARFLLGEVDTVVASMQRISPLVEGEDTAFMMMRHGEALCTIDLSWAHKRWARAAKPATWGDVSVEGDEGMATIGLAGTLDVWTEHGHDAIEHGAHGVQDGYLAMQAHFVRCLRDGVEAETSGRSTARTMDVVLGAYESAEQGTVYHVASEWATGGDGSEDA